jgi:hypothetical protein
MTLPGYPLRSALGSSPDARTGIPGLALQGFISIRIGREPCGPNRVLAAAATVTANSRRVNNCNPRHVILSRPLPVRCVTKTSILPGHP